MTIKIDLYDLFAYTIPGTFYLFTLIYILNITGTISIDFAQINAASGWLIFIGAIVAYAIGYIFDPIAHSLEKRLSGTTDKSRDRLERFKAKYKHIGFYVEPKDMAVIRGYVSKHCPELGDKIEKNGATRTMLRNLSLNFSFLVLAFAYQFTNNISVLFIVLSLASLLLSLVCMRECFKFADWFYDVTLQSLLALSLESKDLIHKSPTVIEASGASDLLSHLLQNDNSNEAKRISDKP